MRLSGAGIRKMLFCCCAVQEAAGGPPAFCVMVARNVVCSDMPSLDTLGSTTLTCRSRGSDRHSGECLFAARSVCLSICDPNPKLSLFASTFLRYNIYLRWYMHLLLLFYLYRHRVTPLEASPQLIVLCIQACLIDMPMPAIAVSLRIDRAHPSA